MGGNRQRFVHFVCCQQTVAVVSNGFWDPLPFFLQPDHLRAQEQFQVPKMEAPGVLSLANKRIKTEELEEISIQADAQANPPPDWLLLPDNVYVQIFDLLCPGKLLSIRRVHPRWQRLAEASAQTRSDLVLLQCSHIDGTPTCYGNSTWGCADYLMLQNSFNFYFADHHLNPDGSSFGHWRNWHLKKHLKMNRLKCISFNQKNAQLVARLFPQISHFTVSHKSISAGHLDQILYLLAQWTANLRTFKFYSVYTLENPEERITRSRAVATINPPTEVYLNSQLTRLFRKFNSLPELKHLTLHYRNGKINSTVTNFAFLSRLEKLYLDRTSLETNLQAACQRYLTPPVPGGPPSTLRCFAHNLVNQDEPSAIEFIRFLREAPESLPLAIASTWSQQIPMTRLQHLRQLLLRSPSIDCLKIHDIPIGTSLGPLSRTLARHNVTVLCIGTEGNDLGEVAEPDTELVPVPSVRGLTIILLSPDHNRIDPLLTQIPTIFPCLSSIMLIDCRTHSINSPAFFTLFASDSRRFKSFVPTLLAAYPLTTQPTKYNQATSFLHIVRQMNTLFSNIMQTFKFKGDTHKIVLLPPHLQL